MAIDGARSNGESFENRVRSAVFWRSGSQILSQVVMWSSTLIVIRLLDPADYGLFAMSQVVLSLLNFINGYSLASALVQAESVDKRRIAQVFGMLILLNGALALFQLGLAPFAAEHFRQPIVADLLRVQALLYLMTPFIALPYALLSRSLDFRAQAVVNLVSAVAGGATALGCALAGLGVWTLVWAPMALFGARAIGLTIAARALVWPSFSFAGAGGLMSFGGAMILTQFFWIIQSQADIFIAGRVLGAHQLGLYAEALFLTQIFVAKFVPPLNEVAFSAYSQIQRDRAAVASGFARGAGLVMLVAAPLYLGLAVVAEPLIALLFGPKWIAMAPLASLIALAMPFMTLQILFAPATNGMGRPGIAATSGGIGALIMPIAFLIGIRFGAEGLAWGWVVGMPLLLIATAWLSLPVIGLRVGALMRAIAAPLAAALAMAALVWLIDRNLPPLGPAPRLALLLAAGGASYAGLLALFARPTLDQAVRLIFKRPATAT